MTNMRKFINIVETSEKNPCWKGYKMIGMKKKGKNKVPNCVPVKESLLEMTLEGDEFFEKFGWLKWSEQLVEGEYQGRKVPLNKPMRGDVKKFKVYVKDGDTVKKVNFGDPDMRIKRSIPAHRKSFRARMKCDTAHDKTSARYWSCRKW